MPQEHEFKLKVLCRKGYLIFSALSILKEFVKSCKRKSERYLRTAGIFTRRIMTEKSGLTWVTLAHGQVTV